MSNLLTSNKELLSPKECSTGVARAPAIVHPPFRDRLKKYTDIHTFPFPQTFFFLKSIPIKSSHLMANRTFRHVGCLVEARGLEVHHRDDRTLSQLSKISAIIRHDLGAKAKCQRVWGPASLIWKGWTSLEGAAAGGRRGLAHNFLEKCDLRGNTNRMQIQIQRQIHSMQNVDFSGGGCGGWASGWFGHPNLGWWPAAQFGGKRVIQPSSLFVAQYKYEIRKVQLGIWSGKIQALH